MFRVAEFWAPKNGNSAREYEDAARIRLDGKTLLVALSDGASEAMLAGRWARHLTRAVVHGRAKAVDARLRRALSTWSKVVSAYMRMRENCGRPIAWYEEPGLARGSAATLTVFAATSTAKRRSWRAFAIGDSCLFHVRDGGLRLAFPIGQSAAFDMTPDLLYSRVNSHAVVTRALENRSKGSWKDGDRFYLATDALSAWLLHRYEVGEPVWDELDGLTRSEFDGWVASARERGMHNDDVTLIRVEAA